MSGAFRSPIPILSCASCNEEDTVKQKHCTRSATKQISRHLALFPSQITAICGGGGEAGSSQAKYCTSQCEADPFRREANLHQPAPPRSKPPPVVVVMVVLWVWTVFCVVVVMAVLW
ncbi:Hypothetical predicted protein [Olea europaea subsp. europaea]|uniref:Uncharacterized protein n=1 Tax=Olea europaea subsp. europaea TaxID=158383 RepID=A0A8S0TX23_OLEEU|nr:Hypothetical predicted protein [Olea europaea subsp. europaea]